MKLGVVFPQTEIGADPAVVRLYAESVEAMGFDYLLTYEHVVGADPAQHPQQERWAYTYRDAFHEPMVLFGYLAAITTRLELVTGILVLPQRNAVLVAKQAAEVDLLTGGRLRLGIGVGWNAAEMSALGYDFGTRGRRVDEQIDVMRALWTSPLVTFEGRYHTLRAVGINPLPVQRPIPLWFGGAAEPVLKRMVRVGEGWIPSGVPVVRARLFVAQLHEALNAAGRDPAQFGIDFRVNLAQVGWAAVEEVIADWRALGATHVCVNTMGMGFRTVDEHLEALQRFYAAAR